MPVILHPIISLAAGSSFTVRVYVSARLYIPIDSPLCKIYCHRVQVRVQLTQGAVYKVRGVFWLLSALV